MYGKDHLKDLDVEREDNIKTDLKRNRIGECVLD
jgi:hypothetical protein